MKKSQKDNTTTNSGTVYMDADGTKYFVIGKIRIKISEHFANNGKPLASLLENVIHHAAATC